MILLGGAARCAPPREPCPRLDCPLVSQDPPQAQMSSRAPASPPSTYPFPDMSNIFPQPPGNIGLKKSPSAACRNDLVDVEAYMESPPSRRRVRLRRYSYSESAPALSVELRSCHHGLSRQRDLRSRTSRPESSYAARKPPEVPDRRHKGNSPASRPRRQKSGEATCATASSSSRRRLRR